MKLAKSSIRRRKVILKGSTKETQEFTLSDRVPSLTFHARRGSDSAVVVECSARKKNACRMLEAELEPHSTLTVVFVWRGRPGVNIVQNFRVGQGAKLHLLNITRGSCVQETVSEVTGVLGESRIDWIVHGQGAMQCRLSARNVFLGRNGKGDLHIRGIAEGRAKITCDASVEIGPKAAGTQAHLVEKILVLDPLSRADAIPSLDVKTHDVQAGHSASVSRIHPEDMFYFQSRGISEKKARKLFIDGFLRSILEDISIPGLDQFLR